MFETKDADSLDKYFAEPYIQHNPHIPNGVDPIKGFVKSLPKQHPNFKYENFRILCEGDLVVAHGKYTNWFPEPVVAFDLFRIKDNKIVEHWVSI
jgi:predicted SnoaL-like aldol condensation-catalyzing enzyme